jgi:hypothetical protein
LAYQPAFVGTISALLLKSLLDGLKGFFSAIGITGYILHLCFSSLVGTFSG